MGVNVRGMFETIFGTQGKKKIDKQLNGFFKTLTAYTPSFTSWDGKLYESDLVRSAIDSVARHASKLTVNFEGAGKPKLRTAMKSGPNEWQTWSQFLARMTTILLMQTNCWIVPVLNDNAEQIGYCPVLPESVDLLDVNGEPWMRYRFRSGEIGYVELKRCGLMTRMQYEDDIFGGGNGALDDTMRLIDMQKQGLREGIRNAATFRFMARADAFADPEDLANEMKRFNRKNLRGESGGLLLFPKEYSDIRQIEPKPYNLDAEQTKVIQTNVFNYFGTNEDVIQNKAVGDKWSAFYDGCLEPLAIQLSEVLTRMTFSQREIEQGNRITVTANRLQYASTKEKLEVSAQMADRGIMNRNEIREIWGLPPIQGPAGEKYLIRGEYKDADKDEDDEV